MPQRHLPVRPDLAKLKRQAKELQRVMRADDPFVTPAQAQAALAESYGVASWPRLALACAVADAIWKDDVEGLRSLLTRHPELLHEDVRGTKSNWGPPLSYAANIGQTNVIEMLLEFGANDIQPAFERAVLQGEIDTARRLMRVGAEPLAGSVMGPCETLDIDGLTFLIEHGAPFTDATGDALAPLALLLQTYSRAPLGKHACLEFVAKLGVALPDTPPMAFHRGRTDLLAAHLKRDPALLTRTFTHAEIFPPELGCSTDESLALHGTPLDGTTLLHMSVDYDEIKTARWLLERGAPVDVRGSVDAAGFGGATPLFGTVVSQAYRCGRDTDGGFAELLLDAGADPLARASLRKRLRFVEDERMHEYLDVTPITWGERFHDRAWVNNTALARIRNEVDESSDESNI